MTPKSKTVVLWGREDLLGSSVEFFLAFKKEWEVVNLSNKEDIHTLIRAVETTHPDIVIIQPGEGNEPVKLPPQFLQDHPTLKVITIGLETDSIDA